MTNTKLLWHRKLCMLFCVILIFCGILPVTAHADYGSVTTGYLYSYFQTFGSNGTWKDIQTPSHWIVETGEVAYCLQTNKDTPYGSGYSTVDGSAYYSQYVLTGLQAILENGYPVSTGGYAADEARYATANTIRFWLAENYCDGVPQYLNLNVNGNYIRGKSGYEGLYSWALGLVQLARNQSVSVPTTGSISFSVDPLNLTEDAGGEFFTGSVTVRKTINNGYGLSHNLPEGSTLSGYTSNDGDQLSIQIPTSYAGQSYRLEAYGAHRVNTAKLFFWEPDASNQQRVVTCVIDLESSFISTYLTVNTPVAAPRTGSIRLTKTGEDSTPLPGVSFALYDAEQSLVSSGTTDENGVLIFNDLPLGSYSYAETATVAGYVLDSALYPVTITEGGQCVAVAVTNALARGSVQVQKTDENGQPLAGIHFALLDSGGGVIAEGDTDANGVLLFSGLLLGDYAVQETATLPGYVLDSTPHAVSVTENGQTVTVTAVNSHARGSIAILKTDAETGAPLSGVHFLLTNSSGTLIGEGDTNGDGALTFHDLLLGIYTLQESATRVGYFLDTTPISVEVTANGQTVELSLTNTPIRGSLEIMKKDPYEDIGLMGAGFRLYNSSGEQIAEGYTDAFGKLVFSNLPYGDYSYREFKAPKGYLADETAYSFSVNEQNTVIAHTRENQRRPGTIQVKKQSPDGSPLAGAAFLLEFSADNGAHWSPVVSRDADDVNLINGGCTSPGLDHGQLTTDETGLVRFTGLRADSAILYRLTETKAPPGMALVGGSMYVGTLPVESEDIYANDAEVFDSKAYVYSLYVTATDDPLFRLPETGGSGFAWLPLAMLLTAAPIIFLPKNLTSKKENN